MIDGGSWLAVGLVTFSFLLAYNGWKIPQPQNQSVEVGSALPGCGRPRRNADSPDHLITHIEDHNNNICTLYDSMMKSCKRYGENRVCFGERKRLPGGELGDFEFITYQDFANRCENLFQGLSQLGIEPKSKIGIFSRNRIEWLVVQSATYMFSGIIVSFYETLGVESLSYVSRHADIELAFCSKETLEKTKEIASNVKLLTTIICFDDVEQSQKDSFKKDGVTLYSYSDLISLGIKHKNQAKHTPPKADDLCTIMYTSGTTGDPKGVMITHLNMISVVAAVRTFADIYENDCHYSYLPYAHILERVVVCTAFEYGARVGIFCGDTTKILTEVKTLKPTLFIGVPRVYERIKAGVFREVEKKPLITRTLFNAFYKLKYLSILYGFKLPIIETLMNKIVFNKLKSQLGGQVRVILSGGAPLSLDSEIFLRVAFCCSVVQGYGLTESCGGTAVKLLNDEGLGSLGPPFKSCEIMLRDVPELNYTSSGSGLPSGEVCLRGSSVAIGYYKDEQKTKQDFRDGWFSTGDIGRWNEDGSLSIIDRKKNIFKLSQGEYVAVEKIEGVLVRSLNVAQIFVYGESNKSCLIAIIHPHQEKAEEWANSNGVSGNFKQICNNEKYNKYLLDDLNAVGRKAKLSGFEIPRKIIVIDEAFSDQNDMLTPSFKLKRPQIKDYYNNQIQSIYKSLD